MKKYLFLLLFVPFLALVSCEKEEPSVDDEQQTTQTDTDTEDPSVNPNDPNTEDPNDPAVDPNDPNTGDQDDPTIDDPQVVETPADKMAGDYHIDGMYAVAMGASLDLLNPDKNNQAILNVVLKNMNMTKEDLEQYKKVNATIWSNGTFIIRMKDDNGLNGTYTFQEDGINFAGEVDDHGTARDYTGTFADDTITIVVQQDGYSLRMIFIPAID